MARGWDVLEFYPALNTVAWDGHQAVKQVDKSLRLDEPFAFLDGAPSDDQTENPGSQSGIEGDIGSNQLRMAVEEAATSHPVDIPTEVDSAVQAAEQACKFNERLPTVNDRMKAEMAADLEAAKGLTAKQWADKLNCAKSTVVETPTWKSLSGVRKQMQAERQNDRRRK